jgi:hypothetical protein
VEEGAEGARGQSKREEAGKEGLEECFLKFACSVNEVEHVSANNYIMNR